jgi:hypothetical protein
MMTMSTQIIFLLLTSVTANADWFCTEASSQGSSEKGIYQVCGVSENSSEADARAHAFENARNEFNRACSEDNRCKTSAKILELKRTECKKIATGYKCYRMLEYRLTEQDPSSAASVEIINKQLDEKQKQLVELRKRSIELERLKIADKQIELEQKRVKQLETKDNSEDLQKDIDRLTVEVENGSSQALAIRPVRNPDWVFRLGISASGSTLKGHEYNLASYRFELERRLTGLLGIALFVDPYAAGTNNVKEKYTGALVGAGIPIYVYQNFNIRPEIVQRNTKYSPLSATEQTFNQAGYGLSIGYDFTELSDNWDAGFSLNIGFHNYQNSGTIEGSTAVSGSVGLAIAY